MNESDQPVSATSAGHGIPSHNDQLLVEFLESNDAACPVCGYNVRRLTRPVCPECRHRLHLTVGASDVALRWFLAMIAPGVFSGIAAIFLAIPLIVSPLTGNGAAPGFIVATDAFGFASGAAALIMMAKRSRLVAMPVAAQQRLMGGVWLIHVMALLLLLGKGFGWY